MTAQKILLGGAAVKRDPQKLFHAIKHYSTLGKQDKEGFHVWLGMAWNFILAALKFFIGCVAGNGYLCVSALYSALVGVAKRKLIHFQYDDKENQKTEHDVFGALGFLIMLSGIVYGTYMGRLIPFPKIFHYEIWQGLLIAAVCFLEVGNSIYHLVHMTGKGDPSLYQLGRKISSLAAALPAAVMVQVALGACLNPNDMPFWNGVYGIAVGIVQILMGALMMLYARRHRSDGQAGKTVTQ